MATQTTSSHEEILDLIMQHTRQTHILCEEVLRLRQEIDRQSRRADRAERERSELKEQSREAEMKSQEELSRVRLECQHLKQLLGGGRSVSG